MGNMQKWDKFEVALLIDTYLLIEREIYTSKDGCLILSNKLRKRAISRGLQIDETFRNYNGILLMLSAIKFLFTDGRKGLPGASRLFKEMYIMYVNDRENFNKILNTAHAECNKDESVNEVMTETKFQTENEILRYINWLRFKGQEEASINEMVTALNECNAIARKTGVINKQDNLWNHKSGVTLDNIIYRLKKKYDFASVNYDNKGFYNQVIDSFLEYKKNDKNVPYIRKFTEKESFNKYFINYLKDKFPDNYFEGIQKYIKIINLAGTAALKNNFDCLSDNDISNIKSVSKIIYRLSVITNGNARKATSVFNLVLKIYHEWNKNDRKPYEFINKPISNLVDSSVKNPPVKESSKEVLLKDIEKEQFTEILQTEFEDGLMLNIIGLDTFREIYSEKFGLDLTTDDDLLKKQLLEVGVLIDNRVYSKKSPEQENILNEIIADIVNVLKSGASCLFLSTVMKKWEHKLSTQLNVYDEKVLQELIIKERNSEITIKGNLIVFKNAYGNPANDVINYMKQHYDFVTYDMLQRDLWFIPLDFIKSVLTSSSMLVLVDAETYFYAPNFPASTLELKQLTKEMKLEIERKGFLVAKDIELIINDKCKTLAINTEEYRDIAYRNILKYLLREEFDFNNAIISEKGNKLSTSDVFREFCMCHEKLNLEELKQFASDVNVTIYWDDVMAKMVRINKNTMIRKDYVDFDVASIDALLEEMCPGDYIPIQDIQLFLQFPNIGYPWNEYVLESYLADSEKFELYHTNYSENGVYGIVVKKSANFKDYQSVVVDILANNYEWESEQEAIAHIVKIGCQAKRRWSGFNEVVKAAKAFREKINLERKPR